MRNRVFRIPLLGVALLASAPAAAAPMAPIRVATPHFELYTEENAPAARQFLRHLELVRAFFEQHGGALRPWSGPVRIVGFRSLEEYRPYAPRASASAHYQAAPERDTIVVSSLASASYPAAVHEYVHLLIQRTGWSLPLWLSEGVAEFYSTLQPLPGNAVRLGDPPAGYLRMLRERPWLDAETLFSAERASPVYSDPQLRPLFYAQSWALAHMLAQQESHRRDLPSMANAPERRPPAGLWRELEAYLAGTPLPSETLKLARRQQPPEPDVRQAGDLEWGLVLAEQLAGLASDMEAAKRAYDELGARYPARWEPPAALARLALGRGNLEEARRQFARAVELGVTDVEFYLEYAELGSGDPEGRVGILRRALALSPDDQEIQLRLALALYDALDFGAAREWMLKLRHVPEERAPDFYRVLAYVNDRLGLDSDARYAARRAVEAARTPEESESARRLLDFISRPPPDVPQMVAEAPPAAEPAAAPVGVRPPVPPAKPATPLYAVHGELIRFDCLGNSARVVVRSRAEQLAFRVVYPDGLTILRGGSPVLRFMACGPQKPEPVTVRYEMRREAYLGTLGVVRVLEYR